MKLIWTKSHSALSVLIRSGLNEPVSHFAMVFDDSLVFHSNLLGTHISWFNSYKNTCTIVYTIDIPLPLEKEEQVYRSIIEKNVDKPYDFGAFGYFMWRAFLYRFFKKPFPLKNKWAKSNQFLCTGLAAELPKELFPALEDIQDTEMTSPEQLYKKLIKT